MTGTDLLGNPAMPQDCLATCVTPHECVLGGCAKVPYRRRAIITDLDHTVMNSFWRDHMIAAGDWDAYHNASIHDAPVWDVVFMLRELHCLGAYDIIGCTVRPERWRKPTMTTMVRYAIPMDELLMRPDENYRPAPEIKVQLVQERFPDLNAVAFVMDDRDDVCAAFRGLGVTTLQVGARRQ